ncbi:MAG: Zn-dependent hydrolase [Deltaproteobacteria bacterium]|nr:Zn-dependent hydrolase [Deltaproteobacteria bacterium]MBW1960664.1 Zn-dependent hydrolase [Deltaproteobacteria bacterium]MBW2152054.1 Zn-dependent hydrolase [Deltaproteobacteria bacterium]
MEDDNKIKISADRLWSDLNEVGKIGYSEGRGVTRTALSDADLEAKEWLSQKMKSAGLDVRIDAATNIIGLLETAKTRPAKILAIGSHLDTVPSGGMFDGALGVVAALECARVIKEHGIKLPWDIEVINFSDEEAAHNAGTVGSRAMIGQLTAKEIYVSKAKGIPPFSEDMKRMGKDPERIGEAARDPKIFEAVLELHIEQGNRLYTEGIQIGAVTGIVGIYRYGVTVKGEANHAGTTPMHLRDDALVKAAPVFTLLPQWVRARSKEMVGTIGQVTVEPGATNVIPGNCSFIVELRSMKRKDMVAIRDVLHEWVGSQQGCTMKTIYEKDSVKLSEQVIDAIATAAEAEGMSYIRMPSGAGHDTQSFAPFVPCGMIFVPCKEGKSHCPQEWIEPHQAADGCQVLLRTVLELAKRAER